MSGNLGFRKADQAIREGFLELLFSQRYQDISMGAIASRARVARSTLYLHYRSREAVLEATMRHLLVIVARAATGLIAPQGVRPVLDHFWENRRLARTIFGPPVGSHVGRWLAAIMAEEMIRVGHEAEQARATAILKSAGIVALLEAWMTGHLAIGCDAMVEAIAGAPIPSGA